MGYSIEYDPQGIICLNVHGELTMSILRTIVGEILQLAKEQHCAFVLEDLREMQLKLSMVESLPLAALGDFVRGRNSLFEARHLSLVSPRGTPATNAGAGVEGLFESLLAETFS